MSHTREKVWSPIRTKLPSATKAPPKCPCNQVHDYTPTQLQAFDFALKRCQMTTIASLGVSNERQGDFFRAFSDHGWPYAWQCGVCFLTWEWTAQHVSWQDSDKALLVVLHDSIGLSWETIAGKFMIGTLAKEYRTKYDELHN